jgi:two-component system chemotaxis response regulator CheY
MEKKIIVVDDSSSVRGQVGATLEEAGYKCVEAADGREALTQIDEHADAALVISDIHMPNLGGIEMIERLRDMGTRPNLPILLLTTEAHRKLVDRAKAAGAKGWIIKPFKRELLLAAVQKLAGPA